MKRPEPARMLRRTLLAGAGVSLALPLLHSLSPKAWGQSSGAVPKRLVLWWVPEGVVPDQWWPADKTGTGLSPSLAPLQPYRDQLSVVHGLDMHPEAERSEGDPDDHHDCVEAILTGGELGPERTQGGVMIPQGRSIDRVLGGAIQGSALFSTYIVGVNNLHSNSQEHRQVSFDRLNRGYDGVSNPATSFADLLADVGAGSGGSDPALEQARLARLRGYLKQKSVLDSVTGELGRLRCQVGSLERSKLDQHLDSVRIIEQQLASLIQGGGAPTPVAVPTVTVPAEAGDSSYYTAHENFPAMAELQARILASALAAGTTRVAVMAMGPGGFSPQTYPFAPLNVTKWHHDLSHDVGSWGTLAKINLWYEERLAFFLGLLSSIPEGDGTLLDSTLVVRFSELADGNHAKRNLPFLIAGMGNTFRLGQNFDAGGRPHNDALTAILQGFGLDITTLGPDAANTGPYSDLLV